MIKIRGGVYSNYLGVECQLFEERSEVPVHDSEIRYSLCYSPDNGINLVGFEKHALTDLLCKGISLTDIDNAYLVNSFAKYKGGTVQVFEKRLKDPRVVGIGTSQSDIALQLGLRKIDTNWFIKDLIIDELSEIWEERSPTLGLPMPEGLAEKEYIKRSVV